MALEITGNIPIGSGLYIPSAYARTFYSVNDTSKTITIGVQFWGSKNAYDTNQGTIEAYIKFKTIYDYDRNTDGVDILDITQNTIKSELEDMGFSVVITDL